MSETIITVRAPRILVRALDRMVRNRVKLQRGVLYTRSDLVRDLLYARCLPRPEPQATEPVAKRRGR